jgi:hypothetical protein
MGIKPYECAVLLDSDAYAPINSSTSTGNLCRYVYGKGYQVRLSYYYHTNLSATSTSYTRIATNSNDVIYFDENKDLAGGYLQWVDMGENYTLPTPKVKDGMMEIICTKNGSAKITVSAIAGGKEASNGDNIGGMVISKEISIVSRGIHSDNGGWL